MNKRLFWIGVFVVSMLLLFVALLFSFGLASRFKPKVQLETCFPESVQGLTVGAEVKYKGVPIGNVRSIAIRGIDQQIRVEMEIELKSFQGADRKPFFAGSEEFGRWLSGEVTKGLRCRLDYAGITGMRYIELDYFDEPGGDPLPAEKGVFLIPSTGSPFKDITRSLNTSLERISRIRFEEISDNLVHSLADLNRLLASPELHAAIEKLHHVAGNLEQSSQSLNVALSEPRLVKMAEDTEASLHRIRSLAERLDEALARSDIAAGVAAFQQAAEAVRGTARFIESRQPGMDALMEQMGRTLEALRAAAESLENDPSAVVRGRRAPEPVLP